MEELLPDQPREARAAGVRLAALREGDDDPAQVAPPPGDEDEAPEIDLLALLAEVEREQSQIVGLDSLVQAAPSLFPDDYSLLVAALRHLEHNHVVGPEPLQWQHDDRDQTVTLHAPEPFRRHREVFLPEEAVPKRGEAYRLVMGRELVATKLRTALDEEGRWPDWHLLWEQHPLVEWLFDALGSAYARGEAPLVRVPALPKQEAVFLLQGFVHNHESEAVEARWMGLVAQGTSSSPTPLELDEVMAKVGLAKGLVNHGKPSERKAALQAFVPAVIEEARARLLKDRAQHIKDSVAQRVRKETRRLEAWAKDSLAEITRREGAWSKTGRKPPPHIASKLQREREHVAKVQANHQQLLKSLTAHGAPTSASRRSSRGLMAADLTGIENVGELFSAHYFEVRLLEELKALAGPEREAIDTVTTRLRALGPRLLDALADGLSAQGTTARREVVHDLAVRVLEALGYEREPGAYAVLERSGAPHEAVPLLARLLHGKEPAVLVLEAGLAGQDDALLAQPALRDRRCARAGHRARSRAACGASIRRGGERPVRDREPPRWCCWWGAAEVVLAERARFGRGQYLRFDPATLLRRRSAEALRVTAALLGRTLLAPTAQRPLHEALLGEIPPARGGRQRLAEVRCARGGRAARERGLVPPPHYERTTSKRRIYTERAARELTDDCLVYLFRMLFLFYAEARAGELHGLPMSAEEYARGYSLEVLRELEQVPLVTPEARDGFFFHESLERLFTLVNDGWEPRQAALVAAHERTPELLERGFLLRGLHATLFSPQGAPRLAAVKLAQRRCSRRSCASCRSRLRARGRGAAAWGARAHQLRPARHRRVRRGVRGAAPATAASSPRRRCDEVHREGTPRETTRSRATSSPSAGAPSTPTPEAHLQGA
ncbi:MAG: hypothetical protein IPG04_09320 [Polyangiaceae bacterium]|nr:hypothetical protein [Polyangiaceae bacterium]